MRTFEIGRTPVEVVVWPENRKWEGRYQTASSIDRGVCKIILTSEIFHNAAKSNTAYKRFAKRMIKEGLQPPLIEFRYMSSEASKNIFCILSARESVFNSSCEIGQMYILDVGKSETRKVCAILLRNDDENKKESAI